MSYSHYLYWYNSKPSKHLSYHLSNLCADNGLDIGFQIYQHPADAMFACPQLEHFAASSNLQSAVRISSSQSFSVVLVQSLSPRKRPWKTSCQEVKVCYVSICIPYCMQTLTQPSPKQIPTHTGMGLPTRHQCALFQGLHLFIILQRPKLQKLGIGRTTRLKHTSHCCRGVGYKLCDITVHLIMLSLRSE